MLIILSGIETINRKFFATQVIGSLNTFEVDGYKVEFSMLDFTVTDGSTNQIVYAPKSDAYGTWLATNSSTFAKILDLKQSVFIEGLTNNNFRNTFVDHESDYEIIKTPSFANLGDELLTQPHSYQDVIFNYNNRSFENFVITGSFSKVFVDKIRSDLGNNNVQVYNIVRHPSAAYLINEKDSSYYTEHSGLLTAEMDFDKLKDSIINCVSLMRDSSIITLRFEDIIKNGTFTVAGKAISAPEGYNSYNQWITDWEFKNVVQLDIVNDEKMNDFNQLMTSWGTSTTNLRPNAIYPSNVFDLLGYTPLSRSQLISK
jgi:hypothetical protein